MTEPNISGEDLDALREFKVHVPLRLHLRLHRHRLLTGTSLSQTMEAALGRYFDKHLPGDFTHNA